MQSKSLAKEYEKNSIKSNNVSKTLTYKKKTYIASKRGIKNTSVDITKKSSQQNKITEKSFEKDFENYWS